MKRRTEAKTETICDRCGRDDLGKGASEYMEINMVPVTRGLDGAFWPGPHANRDLCADCAKVFQAFMELGPFDFVVDGEPGPEAGQFVEVENMEGASIRLGRWIDRGNGLWALRVGDGRDGEPVERLEDTAKTLEGSHDG